MKDKLLPFLKPDKEAYKRYKKLKWKEKSKQLLSASKKVLKLVSNAILWLCAVGGFLLGLIQFLQDQ